MASGDEMKNFAGIFRVVFSFFMSPDPLSASWMRFETGGLWHALGGGVAPCAFASGVAGAEFYPDFYAGG